MIIYGYASTTSKKNTNKILEEQRQELLKLGCEEEYIYQECVNGGRPVLEELLDKVKTGDKIVVTDLVRMTRSEKKFKEILLLAAKKRIKLQIGTGMYDFKNMIFK